MYGLSRFLTHYFEADKGPFRNICDLSDEQIEFIIEAEKGAIRGEIAPLSLKRRTASQHSSNSSAPISRLPANLDASRLTIVFRFPS